MNPGQGKRCKRFPHPKRQQVRQGRQVRQVRRLHTHSSRLPQSASLVIELRLMEQAPRAPNPQRFPVPAKGATPARLQQSHASGGRQRVLWWICWWICWFVAPKTAAAWGRRRRQQ